MQKRRQVGVAEFNGDFGVREENDAYHSIVVDNGGESGGERGNTAASDNESNRADINIGEH